MPSVEPGVVFTSLAAQSVPGLCDDCTIDVVERLDGTEARYRVVYPPRAATAGGVLRIAVRAAAAPITGCRCRSPTYRPRNQWRSANP